MAPALDLSAHNVSNPQDTCYSSACIETAASLLKSMNMNIDPCSDFYQWQLDQKYRHTRRIVSIVEVESKYHRDKLRTILDGSYSDLLKSTKSKSSFQVNAKNGVKIDKANFQVIKNYYTSCVQVESNGTEALSSFFTDLKELIQETTQYNSTAFHLTPKAMEIISYPNKLVDGIVIDVGGLFTMEMLPEQNNRTKMSIAVYPASEFDNPDAALLLNEGPNKLVDLALPLFGYQNMTDRDLERISLLRDSGLQMMTETEIRSMVEDAVALQTKLYKLNQAANENSKHYSVHELSGAFKFIDWASIIYSNVPQGRNIFDLRVQVYNARYFQEIDYYSGRNKKDSARKASNLDSEMRRLMPDFPFQTRSNLCVDKVLDNLNLVSGRFYAMFTFNGESDRFKLGKIAESIKESLGNRIKMADWLDEPTRASAIIKLDAIQKSIGYSTSYPDERSPKDIHDYLRGLKADFDNFYDNEKAVAQWTLRVYWDTIGRMLKPTEWIGVSSPQVVNAFNDFTKNSIFVNAAFTQKPNYDHDYPDYLNYGGIGTTLGHEYSHAFDDAGSQFDEFGVERNWWSNATKTEYAKKSQCFIEQYSNATITDERGKKYSIDGTLTLGENIADNEGLSATYYAYLKLKNSGKGYNPKLPGLQKFSPEALFFINAGLSFCSKPLPGTTKDTIKDEHIPDSVRANKLFQNSKEFARTFNCPVGSKMNPAKKCKIW
ncbi:hypothetical protein [Parasitella parasitica]|uniref:Peptidase M13 C-terminal domain-containing protein n=1 Tax=Parasitella parasitica TaxID=35722 RepID=A0A0B7N155_9FUNG|nr:hypothetical protein [Parasitella parasitica]